jgi:Uri superfamily endonuclease
VKRRARGSYVLLIDLPSARMIRVGSLGEIHFPAGRYAYVGSAMGGYKSRLPHHFTEHKKPHWHIDYLLHKARIDSVIISECEERNECTIARALMERYHCVAGFGSGDCRCRGHLFFLKNERRLESKIIRLLRSICFFRTQVAIRRHISMGANRQQPLR